MGQCSEVIGLVRAITLLAIGVWVYYTIKQGPNIAGTIVLVAWLAFVFCSSAPRDGAVERQYIGCGSTTSAGAVWNRTSMPSVIYVGGLTLPMTRGSKRTQPRGSTVHTFRGQSSRLCRNPGPGIRLDLVWQQGPQPLIAEDGRLGQCSGMTPEGWASVQECHPTR